MTQKFEVGDTVKLKGGLSTRDSAPHIGDIGWVTASSHHDLFFVRFATGSSNPRGEGGWWVRESQMEKLDDQ